MKGILFIFFIFNVSAVYINIKDDLNHTKNRAVVYCLDHDSIKNTKKYLFIIFENNTLHFWCNTGSNLVKKLKNKGFLVVMLNNSDFLSFSAFKDLRVLHFHNKIDDVFVKMFFYFDYIKSSDRMKGEKHIILKLRLCMIAQNNVLDSFKRQLDDLSKILLGCCPDGLLNIISEKNNVSNTLKRRLTTMKTTFNNLQVDFNNLKEKIDNNL